MSSLYTAKMTAYREEGEILEEYQELSVLAVLGFIASLTSPLAFVSSAMAVVPMLVAVLNIAALVQVARSRPVPKGKALALLGLFISVTCAVGGMVYNARSKTVLEEQARYIADYWFEAARNGEHEKLHQLSLIPEDREPDQENLADMYKALAFKREKLEQYAEVEPIPTLERLKDKVKITYFSTAKFETDAKRDRVTLVYAFDFNEDGEDHHGFVGIVLHRRRIHRDGEAGWYVASVHPDYADSHIAPPPTPTFKGKTMPDPVETSAH